MKKKWTHTPGPWILESSWITPGEKNHGIKRIIKIAEVRYPELGEGYGTEICDVNGPSRVSMRNARLIAAAPDLLDAAKTAKMIFNAMKRKDNGWDWNSLLKEIRYAINKAEGK